jgi:acid stress chaperone HdeB
MLVKEVRLSVVTSQFARALILLVVCTAQTAHAQVTVDVSKITCEQFIVLPKADSVAIWLGGYYNGGRHNSVIDVNKFEESARDLRAACRIPDNFKRPIMQLIESSILK